MWALLLLLPRLLLLPPAAPAAPATGEVVGATQMRLHGLQLHARRAVRRSGGACGVLASALCSVLTAVMAGWLAALGRRIYRERSKENQIKPELLNRGLFSFCHGKARRRWLPVVQTRHM